MEKMSENRKIGRKSEKILENSPRNFEKSFSPLSLSRKPTTKQPHPFLLVMFHG